MFPSLITQNWGSHKKKKKTLFGFVSSFCFHHSILWFLSDELAKLKTTFECFWVMETELWWYFYKYTHISGTHGQREVASLPFFFFSLLFLSFLLHRLTQRLFFFFFFLSFFFANSLQQPFFFCSSSFFFFIFFFIETHGYRFLKPRKSNP